MSGIFGQLVLLASATLILDIYVLHIIGMNGSFIQVLSLCISVGLVVVAVFSFLCSVWLEKHETSRIQVKAKADHLSKLNRGK